MTIKELKKSISQLPPEKLSEFREWYVEFDAEYWDELLVKAINEGKLISLANEAIDEYKKGNFKEL